MGMFDTVVIEGLKLPKLPKEIDSFLKISDTNLPCDYQTKDLDNLLSTYTINEDGQIFVTEYKPTGKKVPCKLPFDSWIDNRSFLERIYYNICNKKYNLNTLNLKYTDERKPVKVKTKLTSTFQIYTYIEIAGRYVDINFEVKAIDGKVKKILFKEGNVEPIKDSIERKQKNAEFEANLARSLAKQKEFRSRWYYPILKEIYNPFVYFSTKLVQAICNYLIKISYRWRGV
jgi:hypothetical protein